MKAIEQYFTVVLFIMLYKVVLTFDSVNEILKCDHSNESFWVVLSCGAVYYAAQRSFIFFTLWMKSRSVTYLVWHIFIIMIVFNFKQKYIYQYNPLTILCLSSSKLCSSCTCSPWAESTLFLNPSIFCSKFSCMRDTMSRCAVCMLACTASSASTLDFSLSSASLNASISLAWAESKSSLIWWKRCSVQSNLS